MEAWTRVLVLSLGGALGVNARYWLSVLIVRWTGPRFPWATILINVTGSFAIGFLAVLLTYRWTNPMGRLLRHRLPRWLHHVLVIHHESLKLWEDGDRGLSLANTFGSVAAGLVAVTLGVARSRAVIHDSSEHPSSLADEFEANGSSRRGSGR